MLITIDTLRVDNLPFYGYEHRTAEFLDVLAKKSALFTNAYSSSSWTAPATASLFTAMYPLEHGVVKGFFAHRDEVAKIRADGRAKIELNAMPEDSRTLPEILRAAGYRTFGATANLNIGPEMGFARGFDRFHRIVERGSAVASKSVTGKRDEDAAERILETILGWKDEIDAADPFFLYLHFNDPHGPYRRHDRWYREADEAGVVEEKREGKEQRRRSRSDESMRRYDSEIGYADHVIGLIFETFDFDEDAIVVVVSDHGQAFGENGRQGHGPRSGLIGVVNRMLMMIHAPAHGVRPAVLSDAVSIVDVAPTLLELIGHGGMPEERAGRSLVPLLVDSAPEGDPRRQQLLRRALFAHVKDRGRDGRPLGTRGVMVDGWKFVDGAGGPELYHVAKDRAERLNLASREPEKLAELQAYLSSPEAPSAPPHAAPKVELDAGDLEKLRALGYTEE